MTVKQLLGEGLIIAAIQLSYYGKSSSNMSKWSRRVTGTLLIALLYCTKLKVLFICERQVKSPPSETERGET